MRAGLLPALGAEIKIASVLGKGERSPSPSCRRYGGAWERRFDMAPGGWWPCVAGWGVVFRFMADLLNEETPSVSWKGSPVGRPLPYLSGSFDPAGFSTVPTWDGCCDVKGPVPQSLSIRSVCFIANW